MLLLAPIAGFLNNQRKFTTARRRCSSYFATDNNLKKGCKKWIKTLDNPDDFNDPNQYLETLNQELLISTYGVDLVTNDETTANSVFGDNTNTYLILVALVLILIVLIWIR